MYDLKLTHASLRLARKTAAGFSVSQEGKLLCSVIEDGIEKCKVVPVVSGSEKVLGFSILADAMPDRTTGVEVVTVPTSGALEIDLRANLLVTARTRAVTAGGLVLTIDETFAGAPANDSVKVDLATGRMKFHADEAGATVTVTYLRLLSASEALQLFGARHVNNQALHAIFGELELGTGYVELHTDQFNSALDYSGAVALTLGDDGVITQGGAGPVLNALVIAVPSSDSPRLGIRARFMP